MKDTRITKKVLLVIHTPPPYGGGEIQAQNLKEYFIHKPGFLIYDYSRKDHKRSDWSRVGLKTVCHGIYWAIKVCFLILRYRPSKIYFTLPKSYGGFMRNMSVLLLAHLFGVKVLGELPGTSFLFLQNEGSLKFKSGLFFLRKVDEVRFLSPSIALMHERYNLKCSRVINNGIKLPEGFMISDAIFLKSPLPLVYIGAIESSKGIFNSLSALKLCRDKGIDLHFNIIGEWTFDHEKSEALKYIKYNDLTDMLTFHGRVTGDHKWEILSECAVLIHPTYWDGVPLSILEAMGIGMPVISTRIGGIHDTIKDRISGIILEENTPEMLAEGIISLFHDRGSLIKISRSNIATFNEKYTLEIFLRNMELWLNS